MDDLDAIVYEETEMPAVSIGKNAAGEPRKLRLKSALRGDDLDRLARLLEDRGLEFTEREYWVVAPDDSVSHGIVRLGSAMRPVPSEADVVRDHGHAVLKPELTVGELRRFVADLPSGALMYLDVQDPNLRELGLPRIQICQAYPDTTDENGKWASTFKLSVTSDSPLRPADVGMLRSHSALTEPERRVAIVANPELQYPERSRYLVTLAASLRVVSMRSHDRGLVVVFETEKKP